MTLFQHFLAVFLIAFFCIGLFAYSGSMVQSHHSMGDGTAHHVCPLMGTTPACVSIFEHISHWQSSFTAILAEIVPLLVLLTIACVYLWFLHRRIWESSGVLFVAPLAVRYKHILLPRHYLQEAFSNGILHSKAF